MKKTYRPVLGGLALLMIATLVLYSCGGGSSSTPATQSAQIVTCPSSGTTDVTIQDFSFTPLSVTVSVNGIVKWTNNGPSLHTVTSGASSNADGKFASGNLSSGAVVCMQFLVSGTYPYYCSIHPQMTGSVVVP